MFVCPPIEESTLIQVVSDDGSAWSLLGNPSGSCLYQVDDRDEVRLRKSWEGKVPRALVPLTEGVVVLGDRWLALIGEENQWYGLQFPGLPSRGCLDGGILRLEVSGEIWMLQGGKLLGLSTDWCGADAAQVSAEPTGPKGG